MPGAVIRGTSAGSVSLKLLGGLSAQRCGAELAFPTAKSRLLFAYLAASPRRLHPRGRLCGLFWEERGEAQARGSLRNALSHIRTVAGEAIIVGNREAVGLQAGLVTTDLALLERVASGAGPPEGDVAALAGVFLDGVEVDGAALQDWLDFERSRCLTLAQTALAAAAGLASDRGDAEAALSLGRRLVDLDPYREPSHRLLMRLHAAAGDRAAALTQYRACRQLLQAELGVAPSPQTEALAAELTGRALHAVETRPSFQVSIAVLPFTHLAEDEDQRFFAAGLADDITTLLTRHRDFMVISRQSSFQFASGAADQAAASLGVRYVLTGAMRRHGDRVSLSVQLLDAVTHRSFWAERQERALSEIFALQDEIVRRILASVDAEIRLSERERAARRPPSDLDAWELFHRGLWHAFRFQPEEADRAAAIFARAATLAPDFALPRAGLAYIGLLRVTWRLTDDPEATLAQAIGQAREAVEMDATSPFAQVTLGRLLTYGGELRPAFDHLRLARDLNPSYAATYYGLATAHLWAGEPEAALTNAEQALRFSPRDPLAGMFLTVQAFAHVMLGDAETAATLGRQAIERQPRELWARLGLTCALVEAGHIEAARDVIAQTRRLLPDVSIAAISPIAQNVAASVRDRVLDALQRAGLE
jgi:DNA-binding SARP family transcriptional activator/Flp pilus assembly protein TadD